MKKRCELSLDHPVLAQAKLVMDNCLNAMVSKAIETGSMEGTVTLKISMEIEDALDKQTGEIIKRPTIKFKVGWAVPIKNSAEGKLITDSHLARDNDGDWWLINNQLSVEDILAEIDTAAEQLGAKMTAQE